MALGQQTGPSASTKQIQLLQTLVEDAGYDTFRSARGPLQRQGLGKFTRLEAEALIEQLEDVSDREPIDAASSLPIKPAARPLQEVSTELLVAELEFRGWSVSKP